MSQHLQKEIESLKRKILSLWAMVKENVHLAVQSLLDRDEALARQIPKRDEDVDKLEVDVEEDCLKILALHQPVASDLRFVVAILKINNDLERIGDLAVSIAHKSVKLANAETIDIPFDLADMTKKVQTIFSESLQAFIDSNIQLAHTICISDSEVDILKREIRHKLEQAIMSTPERVAEYNMILGVTRNLERLADHATNIAEDVIYLNEGKIIRHGVEE